MLERIEYRIACHPEPKEVHGYAIALPPPFNSLRFCWEPVIFRFSRPRTREQDTWRDFVSEPIAMLRGFPGAKPDRVCFWIFEGLNLREGDEFHDSFPGSGAVTLAYEKWIKRDDAEQFQLGGEKCPHGTPLWTVCAMCYAHKPAVTA